MQPGLDEEWAEIVWQHSIIPYLEERFFGDPGQLPQFSLKALRGISPSANGMDDENAEDS